MRISELLARHHDRIRKILYTSDAQWKSMLDKIREREQWQQPIAAERIWAFLVACGYAIDELEGISKLSNILTGSDLPNPPNPKIWFEVQPIGPRDLKNEGKTHIDLAVGTIHRMGLTGSGIELASSTSSQICFCEMKWNTDISSGVTHDPTRNQLARDIENAICFQTDGIYASKVFFTVVTPKQFSTDVPHSLLSQRYSLYRDDRNTLYTDLTNCRLPRNNKQNWLYPENLSERLNEKTLVLRWVFFEELIEKLPPSMLQSELQKTWTGEMRGGDWLNYGKTLSTPHN